jgi:hypothetical protein
MVPLIWESPESQPLRELVLFAVLLFLKIVLILGLAENGSRGEKCVPALAWLKLPMDFPTWFGCALALHEGLAAGLIGAAGALFAAWLAWRAIMQQISAEADQAYEALREELESIVDMLNLYWRIVDASIRNKAWRTNGIALLRSLHPQPSQLERTITQDLPNRLDPVWRRQFRKVTESLSWIAERMRSDVREDPLWLENLRTMLSHFHIFLKEFDPVAARKFRQRKKSRLDHRSMANQLKLLVGTFESTGNVE